MRPLQSNSAIRNPNSEIALSVKPDESKWETKIFAGGALIAKEGATAPHWLTSDRVTGSTATWRKIDNDWLTSIEESEPLGQKIYNADPDPLPDPTYDNTVGNADYPRWQCQIPSKFYGNFYGMPWHCQFAEIKRRSFEGGDYVIEDPESNPKKTAGHPTGSTGPATSGSTAHEAGHQMAFNRIMNYTLAATRKPAKDTGGHKGDDDDEPIRVETHTSRIVGNDAKGEPGGRPIETGWVEASQSDRESWTRLWKQIREIQENEMVVIDPPEITVSVIPRLPFDLEKLHCFLNAKLQNNLISLTNERTIRFSSRNTTTADKRTESGFLVLLRSGTVVVTNIINGTENQVGIPRALDTDLVLAVFHTHGFQRFPSGKLTDSENDIRSDVSSSLKGNYLTYVVGPIGLTLFNPNNPSNGENETRRIVAAECN